jgi:hypothetical protein
MVVFGSRAHEYYGVLNLVDGNVSFSGSSVLSLSLWEISSSDVQFSISCGMYSDVEMNVQM